jgi:hypothetical protein
MANHELCHYVDDVKQHVKVDDGKFLDASSAIERQQDNVDALRKETASAAQELNLRRYETRKQFRKHMVANANDAMNSGRAEFAVLLKADVVGSEEAICVRCSVPLYPGFCCQP